MAAISLLQTNEAIRLVVMGCGALPIELVNGLLAAPDVATIVGILPVSNVTRFRFLREHPAEVSLLDLAAAHELNLVEADSVNSPAFINELRKLQPHVLLVGGWSEIIKPPVLELEDLVTINCHGSLLPKYRGASPHLATIFNGDKVTGFTFHLVDQGVDTGDILLQQTVDVQQGETAQELSDRIAKKFGEAIIPLIRDLKRGSVIPQEQIGESSYVSRNKPEWGWIPWELAPGIIDQRLRALKGFLPLATSIDNVVIGFETGRVIELDRGYSDSNSLNLFSIRSRVGPGVVVEIRPETFLVSTCDPNYVVELNKPAFFPPGQKAPNILLGTQFFSIKCDGILKSA